MRITSVQDIIREMGWTPPNHELANEFISRVSEMLGMDKSYVRALIIAVSKQVEFDRN